MLGRFFFVLFLALVSLIFWFSSGFGFGFLFCKEEEGEEREGE